MQFGTSCYWGRDQFDHAQIPKLGVLLVNLGTPGEPTRRAVRNYLSEFLNDPRVIEMPAFLRRLLVHGLILPVRPRRTVRLYRSIWTDAGSPLMVNSERLAASLRTSLSERLFGAVSVGLGMTYGNPSVTEVVRQMLNDGVERLLVLPLYPQYSGASTGAAFDAVTKVLRKLRWVPDLRFVGQYHSQPRYIDAIAASIRELVEKVGKTDRLLFSFHGMPRVTLLKGDPYFCQCHRTARLVAEAMQLEDSQWGVSFQSRVGHAEWLGPSTDVTLKKLARSSVESVMVVCPGFAVDCLETLEEVDVRYRGLFLREGGKRFEYVSCLNDVPDHVHALTEIIASAASGWPEALASYSSSQKKEESEKRQRLAKNMGARH